MKVLFVARSLTRGGAATGAANLLDALRAAGLDVVPIAGDAHQTGSLRAPVRVLERATERLLFDAETHCIRLAPPAVDLGAEIGRHAPDVVQLCDISASTVLPAAIAAAPAPVVHRMSDAWPYHGPRHYAERPGDAPATAKWLMRRAGLVPPDPVPWTRVAPSDWLADMIHAAGPGAPRPRVILNATPLPPAPPASRQDPGHLRLGFIAGKLSDPRKGYARLVRALDAMAKGDGRIVLHTFGRPAPGLPDPARVEVRHHGRYAKGDAARVYDAFDILVCPSDRDTSPNTVTEALAHGRPVIGQAGTGMASYIAEDRGALLDFRGDTPPDLSAALADLGSRCAAASVAARTFAETRLAPATIGAGYAALYEEVLGAG